MKSILSIIYLQTNSVSNEKIAIGLLAIGEKEIFLQLSDQKLKIGAKLSNSDIIKHAELSFALIQNKVDQTNKEQKQFALINNESLFTKEYITYLNKYSQGLLQFDLPKTFAGDIDKSMFKKLFLQFVGSSKDEEHIVKKQVHFHATIKKQLNKPIFQEKVDIDYTLNPNNIKGLLKPQDITLISKNGSILAAKAIDFNNSEEVITKHTYELEVIVHCLNNFGKQSINKNPKGNYYLLFNKPLQNSPQEKLLNEIKKTKNDIIQLEEIGFLSELETKLEKDNFSKFSLFEASVIVG